MIDTIEIKKAVQTILLAGLSNYTVTRNALENTDINVAAKNDGWIGVYGGEEGYRPYRTGTRPWLGVIGIDVRVQVADNMQNLEIVDNKMQAAKKAILDLIDTNRNLLGTVSIVTGYDVAYDREDADPYWQKATVTILAEVRS